MFTRMSRSLLKNEALECLFKRHNLFGMFAIKTCRLEGGQIVDHLTKFLSDRGGKVTAQLTGTHYRKSLLFQGGLEISCLVTVPFLEASKVIC